MDRLPYVKLPDLVRKLAKEGVTRKVLLGQLKALNRELHGMVLYQSKKHSTWMVHRDAADLLRNRLYRALTERVDEHDAEISALRHDVDVLQGRAKPHARARRSGLPAR